MWLKTLLNADWRRFKRILRFAGWYRSKSNLTYTVTKAARSVSMVFARITIQWYCGVRKYNFISVVLAKQSDKELHVTWFKEVALKGKCLAVKILTTLQNLIYWKSRIVLLARNPVRTVSYNRSTENKSTPFEGMTLFYFPQSRCSRSVWRQQEHVKIKWPINSTILKNRYNLLVEP